MSSQNKSKPLKIDLFNKTLKEFHDELLVSQFGKDINEFASYSNDDVKKFYNDFKQNEELFFKDQTIQSDEFKKICFSLDLDPSESFSYTSYLYLIATSIIEKGRLSEVSKAIKNSKLLFEETEKNKSLQLENISNEIMSNIATSGGTPSSSGGLGLLVSEVLNSVKQETNGQDLSNLNISPADIIGSISNKRTNQNLKNKTNIDFGSMISKISSQIEKKIAKGEIDMKDLQNVLK